MSSIPRLEYSKKDDQETIVQCLKQNGVVVLRNIFGPSDIHKIADKANEFYELLEVKQHDPRFLHSLSNYGFVPDTWRVESDILFENSILGSHDAPNIKRLIADSWIASIISQYFNSGELKSKSDFWFWDSKSSLRRVHKDTRNERKTKVDSDGVPLHADGQCFDMPTRGDDALTLFCPLVDIDKTTPGVSFCFSS